MEKHSANIQNFFYKAPANIARAFSGKNLLWQIFAIAISFVIVVTDFDWKYYSYFNGSLIQQILFSGVALGGLVPILLPLILWSYGSIKKNSKILFSAFALGQGAMAGYMISIFYKAFTGRSHPMLHAQAITDVSQNFSFGYLRGGIFWGWPSSHSTVVFAMAFALIALFPGNKTVKYLSLVYALYIGLAVSMSIHWFSDFVAGAIFGAVVGACVGHSFYLLLKNKV